MWEGMRVGSIFLCVLVHSSGCWMQEEGVEVARKCFDGGGGGWREAGERGKHEMEGKKGGGRRDVSREESALIPQRQMMSPPPPHPLLVQLFVCRF